jgi:nuclear GTP-binding protein
LQDWNNGRIPFYTLPPERPTVALGSAEIVQDWAKEFDADEVRYVTCRCN